MKFATKVISKCPPNLKYFAALSREIRSPYLVKITCTVLLKLVIFYFISFKLTRWNLYRLSPCFHWWKWGRPVINKMTSFLKAYLFTSGKCEWLWKEPVLWWSWVALSPVPVSLNFLSKTLMVVIVHTLSRNSFLNCLTLYPFSWYNVLL